jgi:hypothetical protein
MMKAVELFLKQEENYVKNMRKEAALGIPLLLIWNLFKGNGFFFWLLGGVGLVLLVVGILPDAQYKQVMGFADKIISKFKK